MNAYWTQFARRNWQVLAAVALVAAFTLVHAAAFRPALARYRRATGQAVRLGIPVDASSTAPGPSGRVVSLLARNSLTPAAAEEQGASGALTSGLLGDITRLAAKNGLQVVSTEQGLVTQLPGSVLVRAHFQMNGSYGRFVGLLDDLARAGTLITLERFTIGGAAVRGGNIEIWVSRLVLKRTGGAR